MEVHEVTTAHLPLGEVVSAWGAERTSEVLRRLSGVVCHVAVLGTGETGRVFRSSLVMRSDPEMLLDLLPGGTEALIVESSTRALDLPPERPLLVREAGEIIGILTDDAAPPVRRARAAGTCDARTLAQQRVREAMDSFRKDGVPLLLDIRTARVRGDGRVFTETLDGLLAECLRRSQETSGASCAHVLVTEGKSGVWLVIEDRSGALDYKTQAALLNDAPSEDATVQVLRKIRARVTAAGGTLTAQPNSFGIRTIVCLPA